MTELRYPNETREYRAAREALLTEEKELAAKVKAVAARRRGLPAGGALKEDYVFRWANEGKVGQRVKFSELFGDKDTLILYCFMFGPNWDKPCYSCTSLMDGFDRTAYQVTRDAAFVAIAKAPAGGGYPGRTRSDPRSSPRFFGATSIRTDLPSALSHRAIRSMVMLSSLPFSAFESVG